jgi:hypothetical protein
VAGHEDPDSPGDRPLGSEESLTLGQAVLALHYADVANKINQPILASALELGFQVPTAIAFPAALWELTFGPHQGMRFVGGYYPPAFGTLRVREDKGRLFFEPDNPLRLDAGHGTFVGVEEGIFRQMVAIAHRGPSMANEIRPLSPATFFYSGVSLLRDGSIIAPLEFLAFVGTIIPPTD